MPTKEDLEEGSRHCSMPFNLKKKNLHPWHKDVAEVYDGIAMAHMKLGNMKDAAQNVNQSLRSYQRSSPLSFSFGNWVTNISNVAQLQLRGGDARKAKETMKKTESIWQVLNEGKHERAKEVLGELKEMSKVLQLAHQDIPP